MLLCIRAWCIQPCWVQRLGPACMSISCLVAWSLLADCVGSVQASLLASCQGYVPESLKGCLVFSFPFLPSKEAGLITVRTCHYTPCNGTVMIMVVAVLWLWPCKLFIADLNSELEQPQTSKLDACFKGHVFQKLWTRPFYWKSREFQNWNYNITNDNLKCQYVH